MGRETALGEYDRRDPNHRHARRASTRTQRRKSAILENSTNSPMQLVIRDAHPSLDLYAGLRMARCPDLPRLDASNKNRKPDWDAESHSTKETES
jgi:hypothetical protein